MVLRLGCRHMMQATLDTLDACQNQVHAGVRVIELERYLEIAISYSVR